MANALEGGSGTSAPTRRPGRPRRYPTTPRAPGGQQPRTPIANTTNGTTNNSRSGSSGPSHSQDPYAAAQAHADAQEAAARRREQQKQLANARTMQQQIDALKVALGNKGLRRALRIQLRDVGDNLQDADAILMRGYRERLGSLKDAVEDNEKAAAGQSTANLQNRARERANSLSEAALQGAGETDVLRAQGASLRNWQANQGEVNRSFYDTLTSVNSALTDLTVDTRTGRVQAVRDANTARAGLWADYFGGRSEVQTQIGNAYGMQAEYYGLANAAVPKKGTRRQQRIAGNRSGNFFRQSALTSGKAWDSPGVKKQLLNWQGADEFEGNVNNSEYRNAQTEIAPKKPEGATLREWGK